MKRCILYIYIIYPYICILYAYIIYNTCFVFILCVYINIFLKLYIWLQCNSPSRRPLLVYFMKIPSRHIPSRHTGVTWRKILLSNIIHWKHVTFLFFINFLITSVRLIYNMNGFYKTLYWLAKKHFLSLKRDVTEMKMADFQNGRNNYLMFFIPWIIYFIHYWDQN